MVKLLVAVLSVALAIFLAYNCGFFLTNNNKRKQSSCYSESPAIHDSRRACLFDRRSLNYDSGLSDERLEQSKNPRSIYSATVNQREGNERCRNRNLEDSRQPEAGIFQRIKSSIGLGISGERTGNSNFNQFPINKLERSNQDTELCLDVPEIVGDPRATSTRIGSNKALKESPESSQQSSQNSRESDRERKFKDFEKCCSLIFGDGQKNSISGVSDIARGHRDNVKDVAAEGELVPPDGGWGWLVLIASVMVNVLIPGTIKSFGVLFVEFLEVFDASPAAAAWIPALCYFLYSSLGPVSSILSVRYSYRTVTLIGGTFAAAGMMLSYFASSVGFLCISYGVFVGIGAGLSFPPTVYIVTSYFVRLRGLANGLCISGSALGSIFLPPILGFLLQEYGYRGAVLLMGAVTLNVWASALLYEPVERHMKLVPVSSEPENEDEMEAGSMMVTSPEEEKKLNNLLIIPNSESKAAAPIVPKSASSVALENYKNTPVQGRTRKISVPTGREFASQMHSTPALHAVPERGGLENGRLSRRRTTARSPSSSSFNYVSTPYHGSTLSALHPEHASTMTLNAITSTFARKSPEKKTVKAKDGQRSKFFDISLLKDPMYLVILISNSTNAVSYTNFVILLPAYAISLKFDKNMSSLLLSTVSVLDLIGRIGGSALSDVKIMPKHWYFVGGLFVSGISLALLPLATSYIWLSVYCGVFGLASGIYVGVTAVIMADMLGTEKLTSSYGISLFVNGVLQLVGPPICGLIFEHIGSYGPIFTILGIILVAGASLWGFMPFIKRRQRLAANTARIDKL